MRDITAFKSLEFYETTVSNHSPLIRLQIRREFRATKLRRFDFLDESWLNEEAK